MKNPLLTLQVSALAFVLTAAATLAQSETEPSPTQSIRNKLSAGDLLSAESILEVHRQQYGDSDNTLVGLSWLSRGAMLLGRTNKACTYADQVRSTVTQRLGAGEALSDNRTLRSAFGAATEVKAQCILDTDGAGAAGRFLGREIATVDKDLVALRSRLYKRLNSFSLAGSVAPELAIEDWIDERPPTLQALRGVPVVLFMWAEWCGDCKSQAALLTRARRQFEDRGVRFMTVTRYYRPEPERPDEKLEVDKVWREDYKDVGTLPILISTSTMERYGVSSTPTWVFIDADGTVYDYSPVRLTEAEFDRRVEALLDQ